MVRLTATETARNFSDVLNRVAAGEEIEVVRNGAPVAVIRAPKPRYISADRLLEVVRQGEPLDDDFAEDVRAIRRAAGPAPETEWPSS